VWPDDVASEDRRQRREQHGRAHERCFPHLPSFRSPQFARPYDDTLSVDTVRQPISERLLTRPPLTDDDSPVTTETVGQRIRRLRLSRGLSQRELAGPGVSYAYISRIEGGSRTPSLRALRYLAGRLGVDADYLEDGRAIPAAKERELRLADAELELRLGNDLARAEDLLHGLLAEDVLDGLEIRIRAALGTLLARSGDNEEARRQLERVVASGGVRPDTRPDVYETLSRAYLATNAPHMATTLLERCIEDVDRDDRHATAQIRYRSFLANALASSGALTRAREVLEQATDRAERLGGLGEQVALHWERARLHWMQGDGDAALAAIGYARALAQIADDTLQVARAHLASAQILNLEGRVEEAGPHLERAERLLAFGEDTADRGVLRAEQAKREAKLANPERALVLAQEAADLLAEHALHAPNAYHALGAAHAAAGDIDAADAAYDRAVSALSERGQWREAIKVARDWADALRAVSRDERAYAVLEQATEITQQMGAPVQASRRASVTLPAI
jgi:transcriptional regulator with XRE-family HTH domain